MTGKSALTNLLLTSLEGTWSGTGRGEFPGVTSFAYRETLIFTRRDVDCLNYEQKTQKLYDGQTEYVSSHAETGTICALESDELELISTQSAGRSELLVGTVETPGSLIRIAFVSKSISNDTRMLSTSRTIELEGDILRYEMSMHTTKVEQLTPHLKISLQRVK